MLFNTIAISNVGKTRNNNEDNFYINGFYRKDYIQNNFFYEKTFDSNSILALAVFDGMGGTQYGEEASGEAAKALDDYLNAIVNENVELNIEMLIRRINNRVCKAARNFSSNSGSTIVLALVEDNKLKVVNVGDSRAYLYRKETLKQLSVDHNEAELFKQLNITDKIENSKNILTQSLGIEEKDFVLEPAITETIELKTNDMVLLCSDGLSGFVEDKDILDILDGEYDTKEKAEKLVEKALKAGGKDNITVVLADAK